MGLYLSKNKEDGCEESFLGEYKQLLSLPGFCDMIVRQGSPDWKDEGEDKPHVFMKYESSTSKMEAVEEREGGKKWYEGDFGFTEVEEG